MTSNRIIFFTIIAALIFNSLNTVASDNSPNLLIIQTDEHNFRTLGCYREHLSEDQAFVWGPGVKVDTPYIDSLANDGAICTSFYAVSPVCTPSRASFVSGMYPQATGSWKNDLPLNDDIVTFAEILKNKGYATSYLGKWHLDGTAKPGFAPKRKFGFDDNRFMFNRGHWKMFQMTENRVDLFNQKNRKGKQGYNIKGANKENFATDFLVNRAIEIIDRDKKKPFCMMIALPDPHGPNTVRAPYDTMFDDLVFQKPRTMVATLKNPSEIPKWNLQSKNSVKKLKQDQMAKYFGMVKCIDDNVGKILKYLKSTGLENNTVVVFTSDHGDMMCEHCRLNKGLPYETSACIPFVIRYPNKIPSGKVIHTAYTTVDFMPTVLGIMGVDAGKLISHGKNASDDFLNDKQLIEDDRIVYLRNSGGRWVAAVTDRYKLVISDSDEPWLFDLQRDPDELVNLHSESEYSEIVKRLKNELKRLMKLHKEPALANGNLILDEG